MSANDLQKKIEERKARVAALELERASLLGEIRAFEYAQRQIITPATARREEHSAENAPRRSRIFTRGWGEILLLASGSGNQIFGSKEIHRSAVDHLGYELSALKVRSQIADYVTSGYLSRLSPGEFKFTPKGLEALGPFLKSQEANIGLSELQPVATDAEVESGDAVKKRTSAKTSSKQTD